MGILGGKSRSGDTATGEARLPALAATSHPASSSRPSPVSFPNNGSLYLKAFRRHPRQEGDAYVSPIDASTTSS